MEVLIICSFIVLILLIIYISHNKSNIYSDKIEINICRVLNIKISNKEKRSGEIALTPKRKH